MHTVSQAASITGITTNTIYRYLKEGMIANRGGGGIALVDINEVEKVYNAPKGQGRPTAKIDWLVVNKLIKDNKSLNQITAKLGIGKSTLYDRCKIENGVNWTEYLRKQLCK